MVLRPSKGGAWRNAAQLSQALIERGHEVAVCGPHRDRTGEIAAEIIPVDIPRSLSAPADARALAGVARAIRSFEPDLIHAHGSKGGVLARLARPARPRSPVVFTPHQYAFANYFAARRQRLAYLTIERALAPLASRVIGVCEAERRLAARIGPARRTRLVYNGVEPLRRGEPSPEIASLSERGPVVVAVVELHPRKGVATLLEAVPQLVERHPEAIVAIAGDGEERERLEAQAAGLELGESVRFLGHVDDVPALLAGADAFVNPAWAEAFPYSVIEAMSVRLPIVATDVGGTREAIIDGETGLLVRPRDGGAIARAIARLLDDRAWACSLGDRAGRLAAERFTLTQMIDGVSAVYAELGVTVRGD